MACSSCAKKRASGYTSVQTIFRHGTWDRDIWNSVYKNNEYGIKRRWTGSVIDIGAHTGAFTKFILEKGASKVFSIEPDPGNFEILSKNMAKYVELGKVVLINKALGPVGVEYGALNDAGANTGGISYGPKEGGSVETITLDAVIEMASGPILLKLDCEGCEYFAVEQTEQIKKINAIVGEYHVRGEKNELTLRDHLVSNGFLWSHNVKTPALGHFGAHQP